MSATFCAKHSSFFGPKRSRLLGPYSKTHPMSAGHASTCLIQSISNHACFTCRRLLLGNFLGLLKALSCICWFFHTFVTYSHLNFWLVKCISWVMLFSWEFCMRCCSELSRVDAMWKHTQQRTIWSTPPVCATWLKCVSLLTVGQV